MGKRDKPRTDLTKQDVPDDTIARQMDTSGMTGVMRALKEQAASEQAEEDQSEDDDLA